VTNTSFPESAGETVTSQEVTTFEDATLAPGYEYPMPAQVSDIGSIDATHTIVQFLKRPVLMYDQVITTVTPLTPLPTTSGTQKPVFSFNLPWDLVKLGGKSLKVQNFEYFKADVKIKITINANNMTAGRFYLTYAPYDQFIVEGYKQVDKHAAGLTSYPGVELDIQINNTVEILVPYLHWAEALSLTKSDVSSSSFASVSLFALTQIRSAASYPITFQVWGWFENVTVVGPTCDSVSAFALDDTALLKERLYTQHMKKFSTQLQIQKEASQGPISSIASTVSGVASMVSGLPIIGEVASTVSWVSDLVGGVASMFGWSKPINMDRASRFGNVPGYGFTHYNTIDNSIVLGLTSQNELGKPVSTFPTDADEMQIDYVCANPGMIGVYQWSSANLANSQITSTFVSTWPNNDRRGLNGLIGCSSFEYVAQLFRYWRATICFRVSVVKTAYHTGRLEILYVPNRTADLSRTTDTSNVYRYILDITNETEITVKIPFFSESLLLPRNESTGKLYIRAVTRLHAPEVVSDTVDIVVWKWAEDVTFAAPISTTTVPYPLPKPEAPRVVAAELQINVGNVSSGKEISFFPGGDDSETKIDILQKVAGEVVVNLRSLVRCFRYAGWLKVEKDKVVVYTPFGSEPRDYVNFLAQMYRFSRGGLNVKLFARERAGQLRTSVNDSAETRWFQDYFYRAPTHITYNDLNPVHEVSLPFYGKYRRVPTVPVSVSGIGKPTTPVLLITSSEDTTYDVYRAGKDDLSFGCLVGPPLLRTPTGLPSGFSKGEITDVNI
jgi:hypothetical protein